MARLAPMLRTVPLALLIAVLAGGARAEDPPAEAESPQRSRGVWLVDALPPTPSVESRLIQIRDRVQAAVVYPPRARSKGHEGESVVSFEIDPQGNPIDVEVNHSSGYRGLDRAARDAVNDSKPLPWVFGRVQLPVRFALSR